MVVIEIDQDTVVIKFTLPEIYKLASQTQGGLIDTSLEDNWCSRFNKIILRMSYLKAVEGG